MQIDLKLQEIVAAASELCAIKIGLSRAPYVLDGVKYIDLVCFGLC